MHQELTVTQMRAPRLYPVLSVASSSDRLKSSLRSGPTKQLLMTPHTQETLGGHRGLRINSHTTGQSCRRSLYLESWPQVVVEAHRLFETVRVDITSFPAIPATITYLHGCPVCQEKHHPFTGAGLGLVSTRLLRPWNTAHRLQRHRI